ncbi:MAG: hypothetical protein H8M99_14965, partial [Gloeobacteraceae cyanobacterium ES-bin-144]|nr:hypothetical protein [Verrucomicrobiales bacterium]
NFNQLYQAVRVTDLPAPPESSPAASNPAETSAPEKSKETPPAEPGSNPQPLDIKPYGTPQSKELSPKH